MFRQQTRSHITCKPAFTKNLAPSVDLQAWNQLQCPMTVLSLSDTMTRLLVPATLLHF